MKKIILVLAALLPLLSCNAQTSKSSSTNNDNNKMEVIHLTKADFLAKVANYETNPSEWKYLGDKPAIIDFYADWCGPCRAVAPVLEELAKEYKGQIYVYKIDTEKEQELAAVFNIRSIPSILFVPMEGKPQMAQGALPKKTFVEAINNVLLENVSKN
ncbi:MAG: thioredoxin [Bacteroidales bacterium]|nr:thioredoxin [Bacteroidales bacterium]MDD4431625.1 thioredoxin [Bacteroidales bacterium]